METQEPQQTNDHEHLIDYSEPLDSWDAFPVEPDLVQGGQRRSKRNRLKRKSVTDIEQKQIM